MPVRDRRALTRGAQFSRDPAPAPRRRAPRPPRAPLPPREREDAPPHVLCGLWQSLAAIAGAAGAEPVPYDPALYAGVYERVLRYRSTERVELDVILPTDNLSVYDFAVAPRDLMPTEAEAQRFIREVEARYRDPRRLDGDIAEWWKT